jgi:hypothetical protein
MSSSSPIHFASGRGISSPRLWLSLTVMALTFVTASCAYRMGYGDREIPGGYQAIAVPVFKNQTHESGIEVFFTNAMIRELERARIGRVADQASSQVTLEGRVMSVDYIPVNTVSEREAPYLPANTILNTQYRVNVVVGMSLRRNSDQRVLWEGSFSREQSYLTPRIGIEGLTSANALYNHSARYQTIESMAADLMAEAHDRLTENF